MVYIYTIMSIIAIEIFNYCCHSIIQRVSQHVCYFHDKTYSEEPRPIQTNDTLADMSENKSSRNGACVRLFLGLQNWGSATVNSPGVRLFLCLVAR